MKIVLLLVNKYIPNAELADSIEIEEDDYVDYEKIKVKEESLIEQQNDDDKKVDNVGGKVALGGISISSLVSFLYIYLKRLNKKQLEQISKKNDDELLDDQFFGDLEEIFESSCSVNSLVNNSLNSQVLGTIYDSMIRCSEFRNKIENVSGKQRTTGLLVSGIKNSTGRVQLSEEDSVVVSDVGRERDNNQDAALIVSHPGGSEFVMLAVADGMGGMRSGELYSDVLINKLNTWFNIISFDYYDDVEGLRLLLENTVNRFNCDLNELKDRYGNGGTTVSIAIICNNDVLVLNVGDSRIYNFSNDGQLQLLTNDHSYAWEGKESVDKTRFNIYNNMITRYLPYQRFDVACNCSQIISKNELEYLMLCTDGLSDMLSSQQIKNIMSNNKENVEDMAVSLVDYAINNIAYPAPEFDLDKRFYDLMMPAGKDNATCIVSKVLKK